MPLFQYYCSQCDSENEILVRGREAPECPECESKHLTKQLSAIRPMNAAAKNVAEGCGSPSCCQLTGGGCLN